MAAPELPTINIRPEVLFGNCIVAWFQSGAGTSSITLTCSGPGGSTANIASAPNVPDTYTFSNLTPGEQYTVSIQANNEFGSSPVQNYKSVIVGSLPNTPLNLSGTIEGSDVVLQWNYPSSNFSPIGWYGIKRQNTDYLSNVLGHISTHRLFGVATTAINTTFYVQAVNDAGWGPAADVLVSNLYNPSVLLGSMSFWHDAGTLSGSTGTQVPIWTSKTNTGINNAETMSFQGFQDPTLKTNALNGYNSVVYTPTQAHFVPSINKSSGNYTFISLSRLTGGTNRSVFGTFAGFEVSFGYRNGRQDVLFINSSPNFSVGIPANTNWNLYTFTSATNTAYTFSRFGTTLYSGGDSEGRLFSMIYNGGVDRSSDCEIVESLFFSSQLPLADIQKVEGYLAWKYGLETNLDPSHPYRNEPPKA